MKLSIIIPVYNTAKYLRKCLDSVLAAAEKVKVGGQGQERWVEIVCVNDGSTDGSGEILEEYRENRRSRSEVKVKGEEGVGLPTTNYQLPTIRVIHQANAGVSAARNAALDIATGEWVQFLDSDDSIEENFLVESFKAMDEHADADAIEHTAIYCYDDGRREYGCHGRRPPEAVVTGEDILNDPYGVKYTDVGRCSCYKYFRRSVIEANHLRFKVGLKVGEDTLFAAQFYACADKVALCPELAGYLRIFREGSAMLTMSAEKWIAQIGAAEALHETWMTHPSPGMTRRLCVANLLLLTLGKESGLEIRRQCIDALLASRYFNRVAMPFVFRHGSWKGRLVAAGYCFVFLKVLRQFILNRV